MSTCLQILNDTFLGAERGFKKVLIAINSGKYEYTLEQEYDKLVKKPISNFNYRTIPNMPPTEYLLKLRHDRSWMANFKKEIEEKWLTNDRNYFLFLDLRLDFHFEFLKLNCGDATALFNSQYDDAYELIYKIEHTGTFLNNADAILAIKYSFINSFMDFEDKIAASYPLYTKRLQVQAVSHEATNIKQRISNIIKKFTDEQIEQLYLELSDGFIKCDALTFKAMMQQTSIETDTKILWIDTALNKSINKATLIKFVNRILINTETSASVNKFIVKYFDTGDKETDVGKKTRNLNSARNSANNAKKRTKASIKLDEILDRVMQ